MLGALLVTNPAMSDGAGSVGVGRCTVVQVTEMDGEGIVIVSEATSLERIENKVANEALEE